MQKIDVSKITGYETMSAEEKIKALESFEYDDGSATIGKLKDSVSKACSEAAEWKKKHNALLSDEEKKQAEQAEKYSAMEQKLAEYEKNIKVSDYIARYVALGYDSELAKSTAEARVNGDDDTVFANQQKFKESFAKQLKAEMMKDTPAPKDGAKETEIDKKQFDAMSYQERAKLFSENPELYKKLNE